jgi:hypothetical protein
MPRRRCAVTQNLKTTAAACQEENCTGCEIEGKLLCLHTPTDLVDFAVLAIGCFIPFFAGMIIGHFWVGLVVWIGLAAIFFGYVEALVLCRHCPHYAERGFTLRCHANWGLPKIPRLDPRPLNRLEQVIWLAYVAVLFLYPAPFFVASGQWLLLGIYAWAVFAGAWTLVRTECNRCYNLSCPINRVPAGVREAFYRHYLDFAKAREQHR